jgi:lipopolysaccharide transport system ATP-binding protein
MTDVAIRCKGLAKQYRIGERESYKALRDVITDAFSSPFRRFRSALRHSSNGSAATEKPNIWALNDVSFEIKRGEVVGIIGRNGAGKSTLLKILSRITEPTHGHADIWGRVGSLLEVGTGFHPELTGRDNIFLNGAILGMRRAEVARKFDEIVAFAEVEKFIDTPVKRYSSGMYVRLAFAVAAHMETEILLVDEVLSVGDTQFQKKCMGKMEDVAKHGRTVLFVSHSMPAVTRLCQRGILLADGGVVVNSTIAEAAGQYLHSDVGISAERVWREDKAPGDSVARLKAVRVISEGEVSETVDIRRPVMIEMEFWNLRTGSLLLPAVSFFNDQGTTLFASAPFKDREWGDRPMPAGLFRARCMVPGNLFAEGQVRVCAEVSTRKPVYQIHCLEHDSVCFQVIEKEEDGSVRAGWGRDIPGVVRPDLPWETKLVRSDTTEV